jgi:hypothetical protein
MVWIFFWGIVTGVGITFVGALFGAIFYIALRDGIIKKLEEGESEKQKFNMPQV